MEGLEGIHGAEGGSDPEFHKIPTQGSSHTSQATYIRAPSQGLPTTTTTNQILESPNKFNSGNTTALTILFKMLREDGRPLPVGSFTERSVARRVYNSTGVVVEWVTMVTPTDALIEFASGTLVVAIAQELHQIKEWEDISVWVTCLIGNKDYIMQLCRERAENEEQKRMRGAETERMREDQQEQHEKLSELIDKVNDQARLVGEIQQGNFAIPKESAPRISLLQGQSVMSTGSIPRIPSSLHTSKGVYSNILGQQFHQLMQQPKERVGEFGGNLEYKLRLLQEKCQGRFTEDQLRDRLFHGMSDKLRDSVRFLYSQPGCDFNTLLKAAMTCKNEAVSRASTRAKSMQVDTNENTELAKTGISSIREQLDQMNAILKGANFKNNNGYKKRDKQDIRNKLKGPGTSTAGPFRRGKKPVQCYCCNGWGHYKLQCPNEEPIEGSKEWENLHGEETKEGGPLPQEQEANPQE